jgi:hypothetical protein
MAEKVNMAVKLDPGIRTMLEALGQAKRRSPHWLMAEGVRLYVEREEEIERALARRRGSGSPASTRPASTSPTRTCRRGSERGHAEMNSSRPLASARCGRGDIDEDSVVIARAWHSREDR